MTDFARMFSTGSLANASRVIMPFNFAGVEEHIECPVCSDFLIGSIKMCTRGHSVCERCVQQLAHCPLCRKEISQVRNSFMEYFVGSCTFKCKYNDQGCGAELKAVDYRGHTGRCHFREVNCNQVTYDACESILNFKDYVSHLKLRHNIRKFHNGMDYCYRFPRNEGKVYQSPYAYIEFDGKMFLYNFATYPMTNAGGKQITFAVWWISVVNQENDTKKYNAEIRIASKKDKSLTMSWSGPVFDFRLSAEDVLVEKQCLSATLPSLKQFCTDDDKDTSFFFSYVENAMVTRVVEEDTGEFSLSNKGPVILTTTADGVEMS